MNYGRTQHKTELATYNEVLTSGRFNLIRNAEIRGEISNYYDEVQTLEFRLADRETRFPNLAYRILPASPSDFPDLSDVDIELAINDFVNGDLRTDIQAEASFTRFAAFILSRKRNLNDNITATLRSYLDNILL